MNVQREHQPRRAVHGVLLLDKPVGLTSNQALQRAKRLYRAEKAGHTGTLDPLAGGLLPLCFGAATKFSQVSLDADKAYRATLKLGERTASGDRETPVIAQRAVAFTEPALRDVLSRFTGAITQLPPMHSALKKDGRALYDYARAGQEVERTPRAVHIHRLELVAFEHDLLTLDVVCSKGTYIRSLADDIGEALGCGAHLAALQRTASGPLRLVDAIGLDALEALTLPQREALLKPADVLLAAWPKLELAADEAARFLTGLRRRVAAADAPAVRVYAEQPRAFLGSGHVAGGELIADRLLSPAEVQACAAALEV